MGTFVDRIKNGEILISDGATGTNLQAMGLPSGTPPEDLVIEQPDVLLALARSFVSAGSDIILTCTFGGTRMRMKESKYADRSAEVNKRAVEIARKAAAGKPGVLVAGSMGPTSLLMKPYGLLEPEQAFETYREQAQALVNAGIDLLVIETMFDMDEASAAYKAARDVTKLPIVVSFSYDRGTRTMMGVKPADMIRHFSDLGADIVGANCGSSLDNMEKIVTEYRSVDQKIPLWIKPNAGLPRMEPGISLPIYDVTPEIMAAAAVRFVASGANIIGGCCGSTPEHVSAIAKAVKK